MSQEIWPDWLPLRKDLSSLSPYGAPQVPADAVLNTNESPFPPSSALVKAIALRVSEEGLRLNRYPDRDAVQLRSLLATFINKLSQTKFDLESIWPANGSNEIIQSIFLAFGESGALGFTPSYSMHPIIAKVVGMDFQDGGRCSDFSVDLVSAKEKIAKLKPGLTIITTPNNPTGTLMAISEIEELAVAAATVGGLLIVDEAYAEFSSEISAVTLINQYPNVVVIRTMSKAFAFAGARVGYFVANPAVVRAALLVRLPYHLSALTQTAAAAALEFQDELLGNVDRLIDSRKAVVKELEALGLIVVPSSANFILFTGFQMPADQLWQKLLDHGVLIRDVGLLAHLRMTIGNDAENLKFVHALQEILNGERK
jgi:histidinol-phosphate aminotransferase